MISIQYTFFDFLVFKSHFTFNHIAYLVAGLFFVISSIFLYSFGYKKSALIFLIIGGFTFRLLMTIIDPFIHLWDEQFHALVAYNMISDPFNPMLYKNPLLPYDYRSWTSNYIWLHKQPLFLWQMALSMKVFGVFPFAIRLPSAILSALTIPIVYRIAKIVYNERTGFIAALLICVSNVHINIISGFLNTDQNDAVFLCYVTFSFWAWTEYANSGKRYWLILIGLFSGMAILVKWLIGLIVYVGWVGGIVVSKEKRNNFRYWIEMCYSLAVTILIALPWQIYSFSKWPLESYEETKHNLLHFSNDMDHSGYWWYHFSLVKEQYGVFFLLLLLVGIFLFIKSKVLLQYKIVFLFNIAVVYAIFSFVPVRMPYFCVIVSPFLLIISAFTIEIIFDFINNCNTNYFNFIFIISMTIVSFLMLDIDRIEHHHTDRNKGNFYRQARLANYEVYKKSIALLGNKNYVVFNCPQWNAVSFMFYNGGIAYETIPTLEQYKDFTSKRIPIAIFSDTALPNYLLNDSTVVKLPSKLIRNGF